MSDFWKLSAVEVAARVKARKISAREVALDGLARLYAVNGALNAVIDVRPDSVLAAAERVDDKLARGEDPGPMAGVLVTIKDSTEQAGVPLTLGLRSRADAVPAANSPLVDNFLRAGAVILGTTNVPAYCYRWFTENHLHGATRNPRHAALTAGGSSGGAGAAVAAGIGQVAHGGDIAGSIRYPAYACGVHGLRPGLGRVPSYDGAVTSRSIGSQLMSTQGPLARSVDDLALAFHAMSQPDMRDPWWTPVTFVGPPLPRRIGVCLRPAGLATDPIICAALLDAAEKLRDRGWEIEELDDVPQLREACQLQIRLWMGDKYAELLADAEAEGDAGAITALRGQWPLAGATDASVFSDTLRQRGTLVSVWQQFLSRFTAVLMPVSAALPFTENLDMAGDDAYRRVWEAQLPLIGLPLMGLPALSLCTGSHDGVPIGLQIVANRYREDACLAVAGILEADGYRPSVASVA